MAFTALANQILIAAKTLDDYVASNNLPEPSISVSGPPFFRTTTAESSQALSSLLGATYKLNHLVTGPGSLWMGSLASSYGDALTLSLVVEFNIAEHVPLEGAKFEDVARACGMRLRDFEMVVRYAMSNFVFAEPKRGWIEHTASSKALKEMKLIRALAKMGVWELWPALEKQAEVMRMGAGKGPQGELSSQESSWAVANKATHPLFAELAINYPERAANMAFAMESLASMIPNTVTTDNYDWAALPSDALIIDVGGGKGFVCRALAEKHPGFRFIVQDLKDTAAAGRAQCPEELRTRIEYVEHDFFTPQPAENQAADAYFMRAIIHNWPDQEAIKILQSLIPGLKMGTRVIIQDPHTPDPGEVGWWRDRLSRGNNLRMNCFFNAHDRERGEWEGLFKRADERFVVKNIKVHNREQGNDVGGLMAVVEAVWEG